MKNNKEGFTLIELLVVIAIIGILSAVVLASLNSARNRAKDASIQSSMASLRSYSETYYSGNATYTGICDNTSGDYDDGEVEKIDDALDFQLGLTDPDPATLICNETVDGTAYAAAAPLASDPNNLWFCVDSESSARKITTSLDDDIVCPAS